MGAPRIYLDRFPSFCQKLSKLVQIWRSSDKKQICLDFFGTRCIAYSSGSGDRSPKVGSRVVSKSWSSLPRLYTNSLQKRSEFEDFTQFTSRCLIIYRLIANMGHISELFGDSVLYNTALYKSTFLQFWSYTHSVVAVDPTPLSAVRRRCVLKTSEVSQSYVPPP